MRLTLEPFHPDRHDPDLVAALLYDADPLFNALVFGPPEEGRAVLRQMLDEQSGYFQTPYLSCAVSDGQLAGVIVLIRARDMKTLDRQSSDLFRRTMGTLTVLNKMPLFLRMARLNAPPPSPDSLCVHMLCVHPDWRGRQVGSWLLSQAILQSGGHPLYLYVGSTNRRAQTFYHRHGFRPVDERTLRLRDRIYGLQSLVRTGP